MPSGKQMGAVALVTLAGFYAYMIYDASLQALVDDFFVSDSAVTIQRTPQVDYPTPTLIPGPYDVRSLEGGCDFNGCPAPPYLYVMTAYRNRGANYNRWLRSLTRDAESPTTNVTLACICSVAADFNDVERGPTVEAALEDWPGSWFVTHLKGDFKKFSGFQSLLNMAIVTPRDESIALFMDADMVAFPGLIDDILFMTRKGFRAYAPIVWNTNENGAEALRRRVKAASRRAKGEPLTEAEIQETRTAMYHGGWRISGTGMISFYVSDFDTQLNGTLPMANRGTYGLEDTALEAAFIDSGKLLKNKFHCWRKCSPELWHLWHVKFITWGDTVDGIHKGKYSGPNPWSPEDEDWQLELPSLDAYDWIQSTEQAEQYRCKDAAKNYALAALM